MYFVVYLFYVRNITVLHSLKKVFICKQNKLNVRYLMDEKKLLNDKFE